MHFYQLITICIVIFALIACGEKPAIEDQQLGEAYMPNSGSAEAQPFFDRGVLLMHSFEYQDARAAFIKAQEIDEDFAMAYWGEAMTYNQPIWHRQQLDKARAALEKLGSNTADRLAKAPSDLEKNLLLAAEVLFGEGEKAERDSLYAITMNRLYKRYPSNQEVAAFYALSLLGKVQEGRDERVFTRSAAITQSILKENPNHPGALHYLIHSYDDPVNAHKALTAANSYSQVALDAAHALHMPSHIYVAMGMWEEVVSSNIASYDASVARMEENQLDNDARSYHAYHWLLYGYLQLGKFEEAKEILEKMVHYTEELPSIGARSYLVRMKGNYLVETDAWDDEVVSGISIDLEDLNISHQAVAYFLDGMLAYKQTDKEKLSAIIDTLGGRIQQAQMIISNEGVPMCSAGGNYRPPNRIDIGQAGVMKLELKSLLSEMDNDVAQAENYMKEALSLQSSLDYMYGPPEIVYPSYEFYGDWLLDKDRTEEAKEQFEKALERGPGRRKAKVEI